MGENVGMRLQGKNKKIKAPKDTFYDYPKQIKFLSVHWLNSESNVDVLIKDISFISELLTMFESEPCWKNLVTRTAKELVYFKSIIHEKNSDFKQELQFWTRQHTDYVQFLDCGKHKKEKRLQYWTKLDENTNVGDFDAFLC